MRDTVDLIESSAATPEGKEIAYALLAEHLASQALALAAYERVPIHPDLAYEWIVRAAGDAQTLDHRVGDHGVSVGARAIERLRAILAAPMPRGAA